MTRGRCGSLILHRVALSSTTPRRFIPTHGTRAPLIQATLRGRYRGRARPSFRHSSDGIESCPKRGDARPTESSGIEARTARAISSSEIDVVRPSRYCSSTH
jgi:hypothetical protein